MDALFDTQKFDLLVGRIFIIEDVTLGTKREAYLVRYRGRLRSEDSAEAYDWLAGQLKPDNITPLFRWEDQRQVIFLVPGMPRPNKSNPWINLVLFFLTLGSVLFTGALYGTGGELPSDPLKLVEALITNGWPFAVAMLGILAAHEFGHYLVGRYHGVHVTLPYFIPFPFSPFGTMGAFINMKEPAKNKRVLLDIGIAGPLAGLAVAIPVLIVGLALSTVERLPTSIPPGMSFQMEGNSILYLLIKYLSFGMWLPSPATYGSLPPLLYWLRYFFTAQPYPFGGMDVMLHPVAWAGWGGLLVTAMNLIPAGQLDGGHILYVLFGKKWSQRLLPVIVVALALLGIFWNGWWLWVALVFFLGRVYAEPLDQITPLDNRRKGLAVLTLIFFLLLFPPIPLSII